MVAAVIHYGTLTVDELIDFIRHYDPKFSLSRERVLSYLVNCCVTYCKYDCASRRIFFSGFNKIRYENNDTFQVFLLRQSKVDRYYPPYEVVQQFIDDDFVNKYIASFAPKYLYSFLEKTQHYKRFSLQSTDLFCLSSWSRFQIQGDDSLVKIGRSLFNPADLEYNSLFTDTLLYALTEFLSRTPTWRSNGNANPVLRPSNDAPKFFDIEAEYEKPNKIGRNDPCPCGSGKKYKKCHGK